MAFLCDYLFRGDEVFPVLAAQPIERFEGIEIVNYSAFGNRQGADEKKRVGRLTDELRTRCRDLTTSEG